jgi:hypothetical protein
LRKKKLESAAVHHAEIESKNIYLNDPGGPGTFTASPISKKYYLNYHLFFLYQFSEVPLNGPIPYRMYSGNKTTIRIYFIFPQIDTSGHETVSTSPDAAAAGINNGTADQIKNFMVPVRQKVLTAENIVTADGSYFPAQVGVNKVLGIVCFMKH